MSDTIATIVARHREDLASMEVTVQRTFARLAQAQDPAIFISVRAEADVVEEARALALSGNSALPLLGVPVAVKDNIDVAGLPTTAGCPAFAYTPARDATAVARLRAAGAIVIGKTNLDQFATGLVGVRSPYGVPRNSLRADLVPGGSSSGSAVAVARGIVPLALGTDTAGSGRIPAGLNNICGLKPSLGLISTRGVVPACRSLDCVSIFALTAEDALTGLAVMAGHDAEDAYSRDTPLKDVCDPGTSLRLGIPRAQDLIFFGDTEAQASYASAVKLAEGLGFSFIDVDLTAFLETARLLYDGAWVAERTAAVGDFILRHPDDIFPVTKAIIEQGRALTAVDAFRGLYRLAELKAATAPQWSRMDMLLLPTAPAAYTVAEVSAQPIALNSRLGTYTNFVNLLDLSAFAVPATLASDGTPYGVTFVAPAQEDARLAQVAARFHRATGLSLGALGSLGSS